MPLPKLNNLHVSECCLRFCAKDQRISFLALAIESKKFPNRGRQVTSVSKSSFQNKTFTFVLLTYLPKSTAYLCCFYLIKIYNQAQNCPNHKFLWPCIQKKRTVIWSFCNYCILYLNKVKASSNQLGCRHSSVDPSAPSILPPQFRVLSTGQCTVQRLTSSVICIIMALLNLEKLLPYESYQ